MSQILCRIVRAEVNGVLIQDLGVFLRNAGDSVDLLAYDATGQPRKKRTLEEITKSVNLDRLISQGKLTLWDENGNQLTGTTAVRATNLATLADSTGSGSGTSDVDEHEDLSDMPDTSGTNTNHDTRYVAKVQDDTPTTPVPFEGMIWYDKDADGSIAITYEISLKTSDYTATSDDDVILCSGTITISLPVASGVSGKRLYIKNIGTGSITVDPNGTETIDGGTTAVIENQYESITIVCDGSNWHII